MNSVGNGKKATATLGDEMFIGEKGSILDTGVVTKKDVIESGRTVAEALTKVVSLDLQAKYTAASASAQEAVRSDIKSSKFDFKSITDRQVEANNGLTLVLKLHCTQVLQLEKLEEFAESLKESRSDQIAFMKWLVWGMREGVPIFDERLARVMRSCTGMSSVSIVKFSESDNLKLIAVLSLLKSGDEELRKRGFGLLILMLTQKTVDAEAEKLSEIVKLLNETELQKFNKALGKEDKKILKKPEVVPSVEKSVVAEIKLEKPEPKSVDKRVVVEINSKNIVTTEKSNGGSSFVTGFLWGAAAVAGCFLIKKALFGRR